MAEGTKAQLGRKKKAVSRDLHLKIRSFLCLLGAFGEDAVARCTHCSLAAAAVSVLPLSQPALMGCERPCLAAEELAISFGGFFGSSG